MKCDCRSLARTSIPMISVICQDQETAGGMGRQKHGDDRGLGMYPGTGRIVGKPGVS